MSGNAEILNYADVMRRLDDDEELFFELIIDFFSSFSSQINELEQAINVKDYEKIFEISHTLKGSLKTLGADKAVHEAVKLEKMGKEKSITKDTDVVALLSNVVAEFSKVVCLKADEIGFELSLSTL